MRSRGLAVWTRFVPFPWSAEVGLIRSPRAAAQIGGQFGKEGRGGHDQRHVTVPAMPGAGLAVIKSQIILGAQEAFLDSPAQARCTGHFRKRGALARQERMPVVCLQIFGQMISLGPK